MDHFKKELCIFFQLPSIIFQGLFLMFVLGGVESGMMPQSVLPGSVFQRDPLLKVLDFGLTICVITYITQQELKHTKIFQNLRLTWDVTSC